mgnify:FL=1
MLDDCALYVDTSLGFAETVTLAGVSKNGLFDTSTEILADGVLSTAPTFTGQASDLSSAAAGQTLVRSAVSYKVRQVVALPPDGAMVQLVLARA